MKALRGIWREPMVIRAFVLAVLIVIGAYFGGWWYYSDTSTTVLPDKERDTTPASTVPPVEEEGDSTPPPQIETENVVPEETEAPVVDAVDESEEAHLMRVEKFFPDGTPVPEHLLCPEKWVNVYITAVLNENEAEFLEYKQRIHAVIQEIVANHNPHRPLAEVWPRFIEAEKQLHAQSDDAGKFTLNLGGNRLDWTYEQIYNFPEIFELIHAEEGNGQWLNVYEAEMGYLEPDWNLIELPDGREFRVRDGYRYQIGKPGEGMFEICLSNLASAQLIVIDLEQTSDEELERLGGWNYNFNPYTNQPISQ